MNVLKSSVLALTALLTLLASVPACGGPPGGPVTVGDPPRRPGISAQPQRAASERHRLPDPAKRAPHTTLAGGTLTLRGEIDGSWEYVAGSVVISYDFSAISPSLGVMQLVLRSFEAQRVGSTNGYTVEWDRAAYWLDFDGDGPGVPRLLPVVELSAGYVPQASNDPYPEFASNPDVVQACTASQPCSIQLTQGVLLREPGMDYSSYPDLAAPADVVFVANSLGQAIAAVLDVYDENNVYVRTKELVEDDELQLSMIGYRLSEPSFYYTVAVTDFVALQQSLRIELDNYIPGVDFQDPRLPADLDAGRRSIKLLVEAYRQNGQTDVWAFGGPYALGFDWANALSFLHRDSFEALRPAPGVLVAKRR